MIDEGLLHGVKRAVGSGQALDGSDLFAASLDGERETGKHPAPIEMHGAGATLPVIAALLAAGEAGRLT